MPVTMVELAGGAAEAGPETDEPEAAEPEAAEATEPPRASGSRGDRVPRASLDRGSGAAACRAGSSCAPA